MNIELKIRIHKESDARIGIFIAKQPKDSIYGTFLCGIFFGKYLLSYSPKYHLKWCDYYATGLGG